MVLCDNQAGHHFSRNSGASPWARPAQFLQVRCHSTGDTSREVSNKSQSQTKAADLHYQSVPGQRARFTKGALYC